MTLMEKILELNKKGVSVEFRHRVDGEGFVLSVKDERGVAYQVVTFWLLDNIKFSQEGAIVQLITDLHQQLNARLG